MKVARKLLVAGGASLVLAGGVFALPATTPTVGATHGSSHSKDSAKKSDSYVLKDESNDSYRIKTEISPRYHALWSTVTNKTNAPISPSVTFNGEVGMSYGDKPLEPGKSRTYVHLFSGNNFSVDVAVAAEGIDPFTSSATVALQEPVTFKTTSTDIDSKSVTGTLTNNSTSAQTVYLKANHKNKTTETLSPGESKTVTVTSARSDDQNKRHSGEHHDNKFIKVSVATEAGYKGKYIVPLVANTGEPIPLED